MPPWIDLSEHKAVLNVYQSTEGKVLILRALSPDHSIPDSIVQLGFEKREEHFVRNNLRFSLQEIQQHFPQAKSRDFANAEIFYVPPAPAATAPIQTSTNDADKAPWQMTAEEWYRARQALQATAQVTANSESIRIGKIDELCYGVTKWRHERALAGDKEALERLDEPVSHLEVLKKAISEGKQPPFDVVTEYHELLEAAEDERTQISAPTDRQDQDPVPQLQLSTVEIKSARKRPGTERLIRSPEVQRFGRHGFVAEYFVAFVDDRYPMVVEALDRDQAIEFARRERAALERLAPKTHDLAPVPSPARYTDGRKVPVVGNTVFDYRGGLGGSPVLVRGEVIKRGEVLCVRISGTLGMFNESSRNAPETLAESWTIEGEEHPYQRKMREAKERSEQYERDRAAEREDVEAQVQASKDSGHRHLDDTQPPAGTPVEDIISGGRATVVGYEDFGAGPEPLLRSDGEDAERTSGNAQFRSRYRIVETGKQPWNVPLKRFLVDARHEQSESGACQVVFGDIKVQVDEKNADKALRAVHKDQVRVAYAAGKSVGFAVMVDYPEISYGAGERAASNVSKLISQLGVAEKLMDGEMQYLKLVNGSYTDLKIERLPESDGESLYLTHYLETNGDRFIDSEMVFSMRPDGHLVLSETAIQHPLRGGELRGRDTSFANMFSKNLLDQGFSKAKVVWQDDEHDVEQTDSATLEKGIELIQYVARELGGTFTDWQHSDKSVLGQWRYSNLSIGEVVVRISVSEGGVVQVNGDPFTPGNRVMNVTYDAVLTSVKAALPQIIGLDLEKGGQVMRLADQTEIDSKSPIQRLGNPPHLNYRVQRTAINGANVLPPVGEKFSAAEIVQLNDWLNAAGFIAYSKGNVIHVVGDDAPSIMDGLEEQRMAKAAAKQKVRGDRDAEIRASNESEYDSLPASKWMESTLGPEFANLYNKLMLARFLDGKDDFKGLTSSGWFHSLERMGFDTSNPQIPVQDVLNFIKKIYVESKAKTELDEAEQALGRYEQKYAAQKEAENQAKWEKFEPYRAGSIRKPPAEKIGFTKAWLAEKNSWFQVRNGGTAAWSNGHLFDVGVPHYSGFEKYHSARYNGMPIEQRPDINRYMTVPTTEKIKPIFVQREITKDRDAVLLARGNGQVVGIDKLYFDYIVSKHPSAGFFIVADWVPNGGSTDAIVHAKVDGQVVAGVMPVRGTDEYTVPLIQEKIELYNQQSQLDTDDDAPSDGIEVLKWDFVSKQRAGGRAAATAMIKAAQIDGRWFSSIDTSHNQGSHAGRGEPLTSHGMGFESMFDARFDAGNRIVLEQRQIAGRSYDSMTTDKQRAAAREMADWALKTILPQYQMTDIQSGPYERWKRVSITEGAYQGQIGIGSNEQDAIENLRERLELIVSGDRYLWRSIGVNRENLAIEEDPSGIRAVIRNGVRVTERASITPHGPRLDLDKRDLDYLTVTELEAIRKEESALPVAANATSTSAPEAVSQVESAPRVGDALSGKTVNVLVNDVPVSFRRKKVSQYDTRKDIAGKSCTWASAYINDEWRSLGEPWPHAKPSNAELAIAINHAKANPEHFDSDGLLNEITRDIEAENANIPEERIRIEVVPADVFKVSKIDDESFEFRFKDPAQPFSVLIEYQSPGVYMPERRSGGTGPRTSLRNALAWAARELNTSKAHYERSLIEQNHDMPRLDVDVESFRKLFGELRDNASTMQCLREKFPDLVPNAEVPVFCRSDSLKIPENLVLEWIDDRTINVSIADPDHHFETQLRGMDGREDAQKRTRWIATGALSRAIGAIEEELNWARAKADRLDAGAGLDELAQRQAEFMRAHDPERHNGVVSKMHRAFALALTDKDFNFLIGWLARPKGQNDLSKKYFTQVTGIKLPRNACDIKTALYGWAGYRPEDAERMEAELRERRDAAFQKQEAERRIQEVTNTLEHTLVRHNGVEKSARQFIDDIINAGYDSLETRKVGAVDRYRLVNNADSTLYQIKGDMVDYARHTLKLRQEVKSIQEDDCTPSLKP